MASPEPIVSAPIAPEIAMHAIDPEAREVIEGCLEMARERLGMDISWLAEIPGARKVFRLVEGDRDGWQIWEDSWIPAAESYCARMLDGLIPNAIPDAQREPAVCDLEVTKRRGISAYIGVPLVLPGGQIRGAFCCARRTPDHSLGERDVRFMEVLARVISDELAYRESLREVRRLEQRTASIDAFSVALHARDEYTEEHSRAVVELATGVARRLGLDEDAIRDVEQVALLHDVGKVGIPDAILRKPAPLDEAEWEKMREHPAIGAEIIGGVEHLTHLVSGIRAEHERWDGKGYPDGLCGEAIPVESRVTFVCDAYHAMISDRPYRPAMSHDAAIEELRACSGTMFWPDAVEALIEQLEDVPAGTSR